MELAKRDDVPVELTWDLSLIYPTEEAMLADAQKMKELSLSMEASYKGNLTDAATINHCLDDYQEVYRLITLTANYCDLAVSVDYYNSANQTRNDRINSLISEIFSRLTFIESELSEQSEDVLNEAMQQSDTNRCYLAEILRNKAHRLSPETERAISALSQTFSAPYQIYNMAKLADMKFDSFTVNGKEYPLGYSLFEDNYEYEKDTDIRRSAFSAFSAKIRQYENVTAAAYNAQLQTEKTIGYKTITGNACINPIRYTFHDYRRYPFLVRNLNIHPASILFRQQEECTRRRVVLRSIYILRQKMKIVIIVQVRNKCSFFIKDRFFIIALQIIHLDLT